MESKTNRQPTTTTQQTNKDASCLRCKDSDCLCTHTKDQSCNCTHKYTKETDKLDALKNVEVKTQVETIKTHGKEGEVLEHPPITVTEKPIVHETHVKREIPVENVTYIHKQPVVEKRVEVIHEAPIEKDTGVTVKGSKQEFKSHQEEIVKEKAPIHHRQEVIHEVPIVEREIIEEKAKVKPVQVNVEHPEEVRREKVNVNEEERFRTGESYVKERREEAPRVIQETHITERQPIINEEVIREKPTVRRETEVRYEQPTQVEGEVHHVKHGETHKVGETRVQHKVGETRVGETKVGETRVGERKVGETTSEHIVEHEQKTDEKGEKMHRIFPSIHKKDKH